MAILTLKPKRGSGGHWYTSEGKAMHTGHRRKGVEIQFWKPKCRHGLHGPDAFLESISCFGGPKSPNDTLDDVNRMTNQCIGRVLTPN